MIQKVSKSKPYENTRVYGNAIHTLLNPLPERFTYGPHTEVMSRYLSRRWYARSYGWYQRSKQISYGPEFISDHTARDRYRWVENAANSSLFGTNLGLRCVGKVHEIRTSGDGNLPYMDRALIDHTGWYTDNWQDSSQTIWGVVYQLPARGGMNQYIPGVASQDNDGVALDFHAITNNLKDAIRGADRMAEIWAEEEREYRAKEDAEQRMEEIQEEIAKLYATFKTLAKEIRGNCERLTGMEALKGLIRAEYRRTKQQVSKLRREYRKVESDGLEYR